MMRVKIRLSLIIASWLALLGLAGQPVHAASGTNNGAQYTVSPVIPNNQRTSVSSYFDLIVKPGQKQDLTVAVTNQSSAPRTLHLSLTTAFTQHNGVIGYTPGGPRDGSAEYRLAELGQPSQTIVLAPGQTRNATVTLTIPAKGFKGVLLGGLYIVDKQKSAGGETDGIKLKNQFATVIGVQLQTSPGAVNYVKHDLKLTGVGAGVQSNQPGVLATIQNPTPSFWGKMHFMAKVYRRNTKTVVMQNSHTNYAVAPNSHFDYGILQKKALEPGDYTLDLKIESPNGNWHWRRNFSILTAQADKINRQLHLKRPFIMPWWGWLLIGLSLASLVWLIIFLSRRRRSANQTKEA